MASYTLSPAGPNFTALDAPDADAWLQPINGDIYVSDDASPDKATAGIIPKMTPYPVSAGVSVKVASAAAYSVDIRMWDKT